MTKLTKVALAALMLAGCGLPTNLTDLVGTTNLSSIQSQFLQAYSTQSVGDDLVSGTTAASCSVRPGHGPAFLVENLDADGDSKVSLAELKADSHRPADITDAKVEELFNKIDTDKDGALTQTELSARPEPKSQDEHAQSMITKLDTDGDAQLTIAELKADTNKPANISDAMVEEFFNKLDADKDGYITLSELQSNPGHKPMGRRGRFGGHEHPAEGEN